MIIYTRNTSGSRCWNWTRKTSGRSTTPLKRMFVPTEENCETLRREALQLAVLIYERPTLDRWDITANRVKSEYRTWIHSRNFTTISATYEAEIITDANVASAEATG